ncbi:MAG: hypothetical protein M1829_006359 [Trizodia sp. TS-e1964]|nr:MAG: hypothetical protein M1829_006359 [Trizodia sp. TS-e1964]
MDSRRRRPSSPGSRRLNNPMRASTGTMGHPTYDYDPFYHPSASSSARNLPRSPRGSGERIIAESFDNGSPSPPSYRGSYRRPRRLTYDNQVDRPATSSIPGDPRLVISGSRPIIHGSSLVASPSSPYSKSFNSSDDGEYYITPAYSSRRRDPRRIFSADEHDTSDKAREEMERGGYRSTGMGGGYSGYHLSGPLVRHDEMDDGAYDYDYGFIDPRDAIYRDSHARRRHRRRDSYDASASDRAFAMGSLEEYLPRVGAREGGPPVSTRGFDRVGRSGSLHQSQQRDDQAPDAQGARAAPQPLLAPPSQNPFARNSGVKEASSRRPVSLHQGQLDPSYRQGEDGYRGLRETDRAERDLYYPKYDEDVEQRGFGLRTESARRHADVEPTDEGRRNDDYDKRRRTYDERPASREASNPKEAAPADGGPPPPHRHHRSSTQDDAAAAVAAAAADRRPLPQNMPTRGNSRRRPENSADQPNTQASGLGSDPPQRNSRPDTLDDNMGRAEDRGRAADIPVVSPPREDRPIKGILREPKEKFPEHPQASREGVAPLKDVEKKGIPRDARWTKISRRLVNPAALREGKERFEEGSDSVIVLRVLSKEEIAEYAKRTQIIRDGYDDILERDRRERRRRKEEAARQGYDAPYSARPLAPPPPIAADPPPADSRSRGTTTIVEQPDRRPTRAETEPAPGHTQQGSGRGLRENPEVPGTYLGYKRVPPAPTRKQNQ